MKDDRFAEYLQCQRRGHTPSAITLTSNPPWNVCDFCGTKYRVETRIVELDTPGPPQSAKGPTA